MQNPRCSVREQAFHLAEVYELTLPCALFVIKRCQQRCSTIEAPDSIAEGDMLHGGWLRIATLQMRQARGLFDG